MTGGAVFGALGSMRKQVLVAGTREGELFDRCPSVRSPWGLASGAPESVEHQRLHGGSRPIRRGVQIASLTHRRPRAHQSQFPVRPSGR